MFFSLLEVKVDVSQRLLERESKSFCAHFRHQIVFRRASPGSGLSEIWYVNGQNRHLTHKIPHLLSVVFISK